MKEKPKGYFSNERPEMLAFIPGDVRKVLEVGCGEGGFSALLKRVRRCETWGVELEPNAARAASRRLDRVLRGDLVAALKRLPARSFDAVVFNDVLEHMADPGAALGKVRRLLAPGGVVVASVPNVLHLSVLKRLLWDRDWRYEAHGVLDATHLRFFTRRSLVRLFEGCGYRVMRLEGLNASRPFASGCLAFLTLGHLFESRYLQFACVAAPVAGGSHDRKETS